MTEEIPEANPEETQVAELEADVNGEADDVEPVRPVSIQPDAAGDGGGGDEPTAAAEEETAVQPVDDAAEAPETDPAATEDAPSAPPTESPKPTNELAPIRNPSAASQRSAVSKSKMSVRSGMGSSASQRPGSAGSQIVHRERIKIVLKSEIQKEHECPQCEEVMRYPVKFEECGHCVCSSCFHEYLRVEPRCPICMNKIDRTKATLNQELNEVIMNLDVNCSNVEWGCTWSGTVMEVQNHLDKCDYSDIYCVNDCGAKFQRRFLQKHLDKDCPKKIIACAFCDERYLREEKKKHIEESCANVPLPCPNKCDKNLKITRAEMEAHVENDCPRTKMMCHFEDIGCQTKASREKIAKHYKTGIIEHVRLVYDLLMKHDARLNQHHELIQDHSQLITAHEQQIADMERIARNQLIWRIDEYSRKLKEARAGNTTTIFSPPFQTSRHGYRLCASLCLNGDGKGRGTHISAFISILRGAYDSLLEWPFQYRVSFYLLDQAEDFESRKHIKFSIKPNPCQDNIPFLGRPTLEKNASFGWAKFAKHEDIEGKDYVKDDTMFVKITIDCDGSVEP